MKIIRFRNIRAVYDDNNEIAGFIENNILYLDENKEIKNLNYKIVKLNTYELFKRLITAIIDNPGDNSKL